jgi:hypothetical protein
MKTSSLNTLRKIRQSNATWLCTVRRAPFWVFPKKLAPYRPFLLMVLNQETELILKTDTSTAQPSPDDILKNLFKAMQGSLLNLGHSSRPANILIDDAELVQVIAPQLAELGIRCRYRDSLPKMRAALLEMEETINKRKPIPGLLSIAGASVPLVAELYTAAADYNNIKPWRWIENWQPIEIRFPPEGRARYALVLGSGGETFGVSLYESLADVDAMLSRTDPNQPFSRPFSWLSVVLDEATSIAIDDLDAVEHYGWPVAGEHAYPLVLKATPGNEWGQLPNASELIWLTAALRTIPDFLTHSMHADRGHLYPTQATNLLSGVYGNQSIFLRFPAQDTLPTTSSTSYAKTAPPSTDLLDTELEMYIQDWYYDDTSHEFARQMGAFLFQFLDDLESNGLSRTTMRKHESNCWCIGWLESNYGYHDTFIPTIFRGGPSFISEFKRKVSDSKYALASYQATWRKLEKYIDSLGYEK